MIEVLVGFFAVVTILGLMLNPGYIIRLAVTIATLFIGSILLYRLGDFILHLGG